MRIVFLDIDGVIATSVTYNRWAKAVWAERYPGQEPPRRGRDRRAFRKKLIETIPSDERLLDFECCARVQALCEGARARIVVSSSWRLDHDLDSLRRMFASRGLVAEVIGATPAIDDNRRGLEIAASAQELGLAPTDLVVLEDELDVAPYNGRRIRPSFEGSRPGFGDRHLRQALTLFGVQRVVESA